MLKGVKRRVSVSKYACSTLHPYYRKEKRLLQALSLFMLQRQLEVQSERLFPLCP